MGDIKKNILLLSTGDVNGAYEAIYKIAQILLADGHNVKMLVKQKTKSDAFIKQYPASERPNSLLNRVVRKLVSLSGKKNRIVPHSDRNYYFLSHDELVANIEPEAVISTIGFVPEIIISGMTDGFVNSADLRAIQKTTKAKGFTLAVDMNHFTGGCHYAWDCPRYFTTGCNNECPALAPADARTKELAGVNFRRKLKNMTDANFECIVMSEWTAKQAQQSLIYKNQQKIYNINSIIDMTMFNNANKDIAKRIFGFDENKFYILTGSQNSRDERKGFRYLSDGLKIVEQQLTPEQKENVVIVVVSRAISTEFDSIALTKKKIDYITDVVGFDMGVVGNMVNDANGHVAKLRNSEDLAAGLLKFIGMDKSDYKRHSQNAHAQAKQYSSFEYVSEVLAQAFNTEK
ncbi:MAG: hypothetical protein EOO48_07610 [Flavobacterium sp.]|nr:MAG: hypothetical protein EOO48_07610 [Flavobacterium sp.]